MSTQKSSVTVGDGGVSLTTVVGVVFIILKLTDVIDWSWWWVTAPFWIGAAIAVALGFAFLAVLAVAAVVAMFAENAEIGRNRQRDAIWAKKDAEWESNK